MKIMECEKPNICDKKLDKNQWWMTMSCLKDFSCEKFRCIQKNIQRIVWAFFTDYILTTIIVEKWVGATGYVLCSTYPPTPSR